LKKTAVSLSHFDSRGDRQSHPGGKTSTFADSPYLFFQVQLTPEAFMEAAKTYECRIMDGEEQVASYTMAPKLNGT